MDLKLAVKASSLWVKYMLIWKNLDDRKRKYANKCGLSGTENFPYISVKLKEKKGDFFQGFCFSAKKPFLTFSAT